eukprot:scaffold1111_cov253-Pinguiococcus_pyrenoidosus.AAC.1
MPQLDACDADVAEQIRANMEFVQGNTSPVQDGYEVVYGMLQDLYPCLGITCADVGGYLSSVTDGVPTYVSGAGPCNDAAPQTPVGPQVGSGSGGNSGGGGCDDDDDGYSEGEVAGIAIGLLIVGLIIGGLGGYLVFGGSRGKQEKYTNMRISEAVVEADSKA